MEEIYYIYEIPGVKVGCTQYFERRQKQQISKGEMILLETHTDIHRANEREREIQLDKGYPIEDKGYAFMKDWVKRRTPKSYQEMGDAKKGIMPEGFVDRAHLRRPVVAIKDNKRRVFESQTIAAEKLGCKQPGIAHVLMGLQATHRGYRFEYAS